MRFEPRIRTRSRPVSNAIDVKLRDDLTQLKNEIIKWGEFACNSALTVESQSNKFYAEIEQKILEVLLTKGIFL